MEIRALTKPDNSLYDQLGLSDSSVRERLATLNIGQTDLDTLKSRKPLIEKYASKIINAFYTNLMKDKNSALLIGDRDTLSKMKSTQRNYLLELFGGIIDKEYINNRLRVGLVHKRIGVSPDLYLSAVLNQKLCILGNLRPHIDWDEFTVVATALEKVMFFDMGLIFDAYINFMVSEISAAKRQAESYAQEIEKLSNNDHLTGLLNRRALDKQLKRLIAHARRGNEPITAIVMDLDKFKRINDQYGHSKGDEVLKSLADLILENTREDLDIACRLGGDEFVVFLANCEESNAFRFLDRIRNGFNEKYSDFSFSAGVASRDPNDIVNEDDLIVQADTYMYRQKKGDSSFIPKVASGMN